MKIRIGLAALGSLGLFGTAGLAQPAPAPSNPVACLSLEDAMAQALERSPEIQFAQSDALRADADLRDARSVNRPQVSTFLRTQAGDNNLTGAGVENSAGVRVSQRLFDFGTSGLDKRAAQLAREARSYDLITAQNEAAIETALAYISFAEVGARIAITKDREVFFERERAATAVALDLGGATLSELAEVSARLADASADKLELEFQRDRFGATLSRRIGQPITPCEASFAGLLGERDVGVIDSVEEALGRNPRLQAARRNLEEQEVRARRAQRNRLPAIELVGIASYAQDNLGTSDFGLRERIGIDISIPLYSGGRLGAERQRVGADRLARESDVRRVRLELAESVEVSARRITSLRRQLERRGEVVTRQEEQFDAARVEFEEGLRTLPELVEDRLELEAVRLNEVAVRYDLLRQMIELKGFTNTLVEGRSETTSSRYGPSALQ